MRLYQVRRCPFAHRARIVLEEKKLAYEVIYFEPRKRPAELVELGPDARSPTLFDDGNGARVWDSTVVSEYLDERHPDAPILPRNPKDRARVRLLMREVESKLGAAIGPIEQEVIHKPPNLRDEDKVEHCVVDFRASLGHWNERLEEGPFLFGEMFTLADILLYTPLFAMEWVLEERGQIPEPLTHLRGWRERVGARPSTAY